MVKQTMVNLHQEIQPSSKKETIDSWNNLDESQGQYTGSENS